MFLCRTPLNIWNLTVFSSVLNPNHCRPVLNSLLCCLQNWSSVVLVSSAFLASFYIIQSRSIMEIMRCVKFIRCPIWLHSMLSNANPFQTPRRLPIAHVRYIKILTWLRGFLVIFLYLVLFSLCSSRLCWELRDNGFVTIFYADSVSDLVSVINLYEFTLWGRDLVSVVRIRESPYYGFFF